MANHDVFVEMPWTQLFAWRINRRWSENILGMTHESEGIVYIWNGQLKLFLLHKSAKPFSITKFPPIISLSS